MLHQPVAATKKGSSKLEYPPESRSIFTYRYRQTNGFLLGNPSLIQRLSTIAVSYWKNGITAYRRLTAAAGFSIAAAMAWQDSRDF